MTFRHRLLERQLKSASKEDGVDMEKLLALVSAAYEDFDSMSRRSQRALMKMSDELSNTNEALRAETLRLRQFYDYAASSADIGLWEIDIPNVSIDCTDGFKDILGYTTGANKSILEFMQQSFPQQAVRDVREVIFAPADEENRLIQIRAPIPDANSGIKWVLIQGRVVERHPETGQPVIVAGTLADITKQVDHEQALEKFNQLSAEVDTGLQEKCQQVLQTLRAVIGGDFVRINRLDGDKLIVTYAAGEKTGMPLGTENSVSASLCGFCLESAEGFYSINSLARQGFADHPARKNLGVESYMGAVIIVRGEVYGTLCLTGAEAIQFSELNSNLLKVAARWLGGQIELAQSREAMHDAHVRAVEANKAKSEFLATMSHEIRTPLNGIMSLVELLQESAANELQKTQLNTMQRSCNTLLTVISDVLDFSKIESGKIELEARVFDLNLSIRDVVGVFQALANERGVELVVSCMSDLPNYLLGDDSRLRQILNNLLSNALKFTQEGTVSLTVTAEKIEGKAHITFALQDSGIGMNTEQTARVFEKFTQADNSTTRRYGGTGLGLAISQQLTELMGGKISLESTLGKGTLVTVTLPFLQKSADDYRGETDAPEKNRKQFQANILVVEDNTVNQYVIKAMLNSMGCDVTIAENGIEALRKLDHSCFDLILMDMQMPEMDGIATTEHIRQQRAIADIPIIALTANALASDKERCLAAGMNDFLLKPIKKSQMEKIIGEYLSQHLIG